MSDTTPLFESVDLTAEAVVFELRQALDRFPRFNSPHEGWAVIREELDELWEHVKANTGQGLDARREAIQIAAMAMRYALECPDRSYIARAQQVSTDAALARLERAND